MGVHREGGYLLTVVGGVYIGWYIASLVPWVVYAPLLASQKGITLPPSLPEGYKPPF